MHVNTIVIPIKIPSLCIVFKPTLWCFLAAPSICTQCHGIGWASDTTAVWVWLKSLPRGKHTTLKITHRIESALIGRCSHQNRAITTQHAHNDNDIVIVIVMHARPVQVHGLVCHLALAAGRLHAALERRPRAPCRGPCLTGTRRIHDIVYS